MCEDGVKNILVGILKITQMYDISCVNSMTKGVGRNG